jgi:hypothetical protein
LTGLFGTTGASAGLSVFAVASDAEFAVAS